MMANVSLEPVISPDASHLFKDEAEGTTALGTWSGDISCELLISLTGFLIIISIGFYLRIGGFHMMSL